MKVLNKNFEFWRIRVPLWQIHATTLTTEDDMSKRAVAEQVVDKAQLFGAAETFSAITGLFFPTFSNVASQGLNDETCLSCGVWKREGVKEVKMEHLLLPSLKQSRCGETTAGRGPSPILWLQVKERRGQWIWDRQTDPGAKAGRGVGCPKPSGSEPFWRTYYNSSTKPYTGGASWPLSSGVSHPVSGSQRRSSGICTSCQYLEPPSTYLWSSQLVRFWLDVESFRCSASMVITSSWAPPRVSRERLDRCKVLLELLSFRNLLPRESHPILLGCELPEHWTIKRATAILISLFSLGGKHILQCIESLTSLQGARITWIRVQLWWRWGGSVSGATWQDSLQLLLNGQLWLWSRH